MTNVFLSWSGETSKRLAEELRRWIPSVLQFAKPYFTPSDVEKGAKWGSEISEKLAETHVGIICLTPENYQRPWILFEAGALSKDLDNSRICSILFGMDNSDLAGPLTTFQTTSFNKADFKQLVHSINEAGGDQRLNRDTFDDVFEMWWPRLDSAIQEILSSDGEQKETELRSDREILEEVLSLSRISASQTKRSSSNFSTDALIHIIKVATGLTDEAENYKDKYILNAVDEIYEAAEHITVRSGRLSEVGETLHALKSRISTARAQMESSRDPDEEIPF